MADRTLTYANAGVNVRANAAWVDRIRHAMVSTYGPRVASRHNAFAGLFRLDYDEELFRRNYRQPVLVACADGVGSKVLVAIEMNNLATIGIDLVAMNVNDLITCGAEPLFFLDYLAVHQLKPAALADLMEGVAAGCREAGCALLGGETAEMPEIYKAGELDLAGFSVGVVELHRNLDSNRVEPGDLVIGLPSSGIHSNGYSLVRKLVRRRRWRWDQCFDELGETLGEAVLRPTRIYVAAILGVLRQYRVKRVVNAMAHITGGGLAENIERVLPRGCGATLQVKSWPKPSIFALLQRAGIARKEMFRVFNMGIGFVLIARPAYAEGVCRRLRRAGEAPVIIGRVKRGNRVDFKH
jgi:phosphoribosylformylglycinamidine cyclo-ligase